MERQQVLYLWANGSALDSGTIGWAFHDGTSSRATAMPDGCLVHAPTRERIRPSETATRVPNSTPRQTRL